MADTKISIKLLVDKEKNRVVFAECDKDFVDILFSFLTLPMGTIVRLLNKKSEVGCMDNLYQSVETLETEYFETDACKSMLLRPVSAAQNCYRNLVLNVDDSTEGNIRFYICPTWTCATETHCLCSMFENAKCLCGKKMDRRVTRSKLKIGEKDKLDGVFVKGIRKFIISDDLKVKMVSCETSLSILSGFGIQDGSSLEEKVVSVGINEVLSILARSMLSKTPMTDVFSKENNMNRKVIKTENIVIKSETSDMQSEAEKMSITLLVRKSNDKVLYTVVNDQFVNFLFSFLGFPLASIVKACGGNSSIGVIDNLHRSVEELYSINPGIFVNCMLWILNPKVATHHGIGNQLLSIKEDNLEVNSILKCGTCWKNKPADDCIHGLQRVNIRLINPKYHDTVAEKGKGFVNSSTMLMVTDDLIVEPLSPISTISFVNKLGIPFNELEERTVSVGEQEALSILKASLTSNTALTSVFCQKN